MGNKLIYDEKDSIILDDGSPRKDDKKAKRRRDTFYALNKPEYLEREDKGTLNGKINHMQRFVDTYKQIRSVQDIFLQEVSITGNFNTIYNL